MNNETVLQPGQTVWRWSIRPNPSLQECTVLTVYSKCVIASATTSNRITTIRRENIELTRADAGRALVAASDKEIAALRDRVETLAADVGALVRSDEPVPVAPSR